MVIGGFQILDLIELFFFTTYRLPVLHTVCTHEVELTVQLYVCYNTVVGGLWIFNKNVLVSFFFIIKKCCALHNVHTQSRYLRTTTKKGNILCVLSFNVCVLYQTSKV